MFIQTTHRLEFRHDGDVFTTTGNGTSEYAPDWIVFDDYFDLVKKAKQVIVLSDLPGNAPSKETEDELIDGVSIYSWRFPAVNYLVGVEPELYAAIQERLKVGLLDFTDANRVTLINGQYVRNAVIQQIAEQFMKDLEAPQEPSEPTPVTLPETPSVPAAETETTEAKAEAAPGVSIPQIPQVAVEPTAPKGRGKAHKSNAETEPTPVEAP